MRNVTPTAALIALSLALSPGSSAEEPDDAYAVLDRIEGSFVHLNLVPVRPMVVRGGNASETTDLFAVNTPNSTVEHFVDDSSVPAVHPVPWGPVSIAWWDGDPEAPEDDPELLVVCAGSDALLMMTPDGAYRALIDLPAEPADIVVDETTEQAFVSCSGTDEVVRVDLVLRKVVVRYSEETTPGFRMKHPLFLALDASGRVIVSPMLSGNNTVAAPDDENGLLAASTVVDLSGDPDPARRLPDEDLFRIDPVAGTAEVLATGVGAVQFGNGFNPFDGRFWQLNTKARNADPNLPTEPALRGIFARNEVTIVDLSTPGTLQHVDLDLAMGSGSIDSTRTMGQPYAITFAANGVAFIAGLLTDNVMLMRDSGAFLNEWDLPDGSIPRGLHLNTDKTELWVYCSGTNEVRVHHPLGAFVRTHPLSHDPTPPAVRRGRELFYDASLSLNNNVSCATCHVEGGSDLLVWNLSAGPSDDKGPMLTQTLRGIEATQPLHWRGERAHLSDFRGAFAGLLGSPVDATASAFDDDFEDFQAFVFSLQTRSNPYQNFARVLDPDIEPPVVNGDSDARKGQEDWLGTTTFFEHSCNDCHSMPKGTLNDLYPDVTKGHFPKRATFKIASFQEIWRRQQSRVNLASGVFGEPVGQDPHVRAFLGSGMSHAGQVADFHAFVHAVNAEFFDNHTDVHDHIAALGHQWDQGLAPAAQFAVLLSAATASDVTDLLGQVAARNCGIAVYGEHLVLPGPTLQRRAWFYDRIAMVFRSEQPSDGTRTIQDFLANAAVETSLFVGWPLGMAEGMSIDRDLDGLENAIDPNPLQPDVDPADVTKPQFLLNAPRTLWVPWRTAKVARLIFETDEYTTATIQVDDGSTVRTIEPPGHSKLHSVLLTHLEPSPNASAPVSHTVTVQVTDRAGNVETYQHVDLFDTRPFTQGVRESTQLVVQDLSWTTASVAGGTFTGSATLVVRHKRDPAFASPVADCVAVFRLVTDDPALILQPNATGTTVLADRVGIPLSPTEHWFLGTGGPFLVTAPTDVSGTTQVDFQLSGPFPTGPLKLSLEAIVQHDPNGGSVTLDCSGPDCVVSIPVPPDTTEMLAKDRFDQWSFPDTLPERRVLVHEF